MSIRFFESIKLFAAALFTTAVFLSSAASAATLNFRQPDIGARHIAFVYAGDIWIADLDGSNARRLTIDPAQELYPQISPDGSMVAFTGNYDGNPDIYVVGIDGGQPKRLTFHPSADIARGWTPDGSAVLFTAQRDLTYERGGALFTVSTKGGLPTRLAMPYAWDGDYSTDGKRIAYQPFPSGYSGISGWRHYRGGTTPPIWLFDLSSQEIERIPHDRVNDAHPMWVGNRVYFVSDRNGTANIFAYESDGSVHQVTKLDDWDVRWAAASNDAIIFEAGGGLNRLALDTETVTPLEININPDLPEARAHWVPAAKTVTSAGISPSGTRALFAARGDILTVPAKKGDVRNLTRSPDSHERDPLWSPDGSEIAYVSDASGEYQMVISRRDGLGDKRTISLGPPDYYSLLSYSPDGSRIVYTHSGLKLFSIATSGDLPRVEIDTAASNLGSGYEVSISPDSRWLAYTKVLHNRFNVLMLYNFETGDHYQVTEGLGEVGSPVFSRDGKYIYFTASTNIGPAKVGLDMTTQERPIRRGIYAAVLAADGKTPLPPESDDESTKKAADEGDKDGGDKKSDDAEKKEETPATKVDVEGLSGRVVALPVPERDYVSLAVAKDGNLLYVERQQPGITIEPPGSEQQAIHTLRRFKFDDREQEGFIDGVAGFAMSQDGTKMLVALPHQSYSIFETSKKPSGPGDALNMGAAQVYVVPHEEWRQIYEESWRIYRDFFYDPNMHGADWQAVHDKYSPLVDQVGSRQDLSYILVEMVAEVVSSHARAAGGDTVTAQGAPVGLLGADFTIENGGYRISRIYTGENWNPFLKAPLAVPGLGVSEGDYIVAVNGQALTGSDNIYSLFEGTVGKQTVIEVNDRPTRDGAREVTVEPIPNEQALRRWKWVEDNRHKVEAATDGQVGYVYLPNTAGAGFTYFNRFYFSQIDKKAIILDERGNGGGQAANYFIDVVTRPYLSSWKGRHGDMFTTPGGAIFGPKVMLADQFAGSGGDYLPYMFKFVGAGPLIGTRTWGGLIGGGPIVPLIDGGFLNVPVFRFLDPYGKWTVENEGVPPDIEVEQIPKDVIAGHDPQLERGIQEIKKLLEGYTPPNPATAPALPTPAANDP